MSPSNDLVFFFVPCIFFRNERAYMKYFLCLILLCPALLQAQLVISPSASISDVSNLVGKVVSVSGSVSAVSLDGLSQTAAIVTLLGGVRVRISRIPPPNGSSCGRQFEKMMYKDVLKSYRKGQEVSFSGVLCRSLSRLLVDTTQ